MRRKLVVIITAICLAAIFLPTVSRAAMTPYFIGVNDELLPFVDDNMPYISGGEIFVPPGVFSGASVHSIGAPELDQVRLYRGSGGHLDFYTARGVTQDQDGNTLPWPSARKVGNRFYVPLYQVCEFFGLTVEILDISREIIPQEQMKVIRIRSGGGFNGPTFVGVHRNIIRAAYNEYYAPPPSPPPSPTPVSPGEPEPTEPVEEPPPRYPDVTIFLSFRDISAGGADLLLELIDANAASDYRFCFFVNVNDINEDPGLIRRISGSGHMVGIWLENGTLAEYNETSAVLYEAAKIKTILVSAFEMTGAETAMAEAQGLILWQASSSLIYDDMFLVPDVTGMIATQSGARQNIMSSCSENSVLILSGILSYLREFEYTIVEITETVVPPETE